MTAKNTTQCLVGTAWIFQEMKEMLISINKKLDMIIKLHKEAMMKKMANELGSVTEVDLAGDGNESDLSGIAEDEPNLLDDKEIKALLFDTDEVGPELLSEEEIKPYLIGTDGFKVELNSSILIEEVVSETQVFGAAENNQLDAIMKHG